MFTIKLFRGEEEIKEIKVQQTGERTMIGDDYYKVEEPRLGQPIFVHESNTGDLALALKALKIVHDQERQFPEEEEDDE